MSSENHRETSPGPSLRWEYDAFLSYSTGADYRLATKLEEFLERFHREEGVRQHTLKSLRICMDGSDFTLPRRARLVGQSQDDSERIKEIIRPYLERSASLLVLWPGRDGAGPFMDWELKEFLAQSERNGWDRPVRLAVTRGNQPASEVQQFFSPRQIEHALHLDIYYDFRGAQVSSSAWAKVRDFERERFRLAIDLENPLSQDGRALSPDDVFPAWQREQLKAYRSDRSILIFRSVIGFGGAAGMLLLARLFLGFPSNWLPLGGVAAVGMLGVLPSSFRLRSAIGFGLAFLVLAPFYVLGSLQPFSKSIQETILFACATIVGFSGAGAVGASLSKQLKATLGAKDFALGGITAATLWLIGQDWRIDPLQSQILGPWQLIRWQVLILRLPDVLRDSNMTYLLPFFAGTIVSAFFYGKDLAKSRSPIATKASGDAGYFSSLRRPLRLIIVGTGMLLVALFSFSLSPWYQGFIAERYLNDKLLEEHNYSTPVVEAFRTAVRSRNALTAIGAVEKAKTFSAVLSTWIKDYGANANKLMDKACLLTDITQELNRAGAHDEACTILEVAFTTAEKTNDVRIFARIAAVAHSIGEFKFRDEVLQAAVALHNDTVKAEVTAKLASALYDAGNVTEARRLFQITVSKIATYDEKGHGMFPDYDRQTASVGAAMWGTGIWQTLPDWRYGLGISPWVALAMWDKGERDLALDTVFHRGNVHWAANHPHRQFVRAAAKVGAFDAAFGALSRLNASEEIGCLEEIVLAALERNDHLRLQQAVQRIRQNLTPVREDSYYRDSQVRVRYAKLLATAGYHAEALGNFGRLDQNRGDVLIAIAEDMIRKGNLGVAQKRLSAAWKSLKTDSGYLDKRDGPLNVIGENMARAGDLRGARFIAEEFTAPALLRGDEYRLHACEIYCAILEARAKSPDLHGP